MRARRFDGPDGPKPMPKSGSWDGKVGNTSFQRRRKSRCRCRSERRSGRRRNQGTRRRQSRVQSTGMLMRARARSTVLTGPKPMPKSGLMRTAKSATLPFSGDAKAGVVADQKGVQAGVDAKAHAEGKQGPVAGRPMLWRCVRRTRWTARIWRSPRVPPEKSVRDDPRRHQRPRERRQKGVHARADGDASAEAGGKGRCSRRSEQRVRRQGNVYKNF